MGILKNLTVSHKRESNGNYSILLQKTPPINQPCLIFEAGTVVSLNPEEAEKVRRNGGYTRLLEGYACLGMLQHAHEGSHEVLFLTIVTNCVSVGKIQNSEIFCIADVFLLSMRDGPDDQQLVYGLKRLLGSGSFYFSHSSVSTQKPYDLTLTSQRAYLTTNTDNRFFWNRLLHSHFERFGVDPSTWLVKALCGGVNISTVYIGGLQAKACLISRLSCERAGTRFNVRGVNDSGHVANFVETEQAIFINQTVLSYLMIRGSIPLFWEQPGVQVGSHRIKISRGSEISQPAYDKHMLLLKQRFESVVFINLLSSRESELPLNQLFNVHHKSSKIGAGFPFINFDYHALCSRGHKENLEKLYSYELKKYCDQYGFFHADKDKILQLQRGVLRTNCLDCLDRTNSVQTFIGLKMLTKIVKSMEKLDSEKVLPRLHDVFEGLWAHSGDQISRIYTGTGALEGRNIIKDGTLSIARTIQNNLLDDGKQGAIDLLILGRTLNLDYYYRAASLLPHYFIYGSPCILRDMCDRYLDYCKVEPIKIAIATWNVNGGRHFDNIMYNRARPVSDWLVDYRSSVELEPDDADLLNSNKSNSPVDIYAIGFQEIVDLNASNIVASSTQNQRDWLIEIQKTISRENQYLLVSSVQLVGVCLFVFIRSNLAPFIQDVCNDQVKTGLGGATGNKGGVAIRLRYKATSLCFVCAHFAAGQHQVKERNDDYAEITRRIQFSMGRSINSHDYVFWCGDFNYRLDKIANEDARRAATQGDYSSLLQCDQLKISQAAGLTFKDYVEANINFAPTYKYDVNSNDYDTGEKFRMPAYTDRILFKKRHETHRDEKLTEKSQIKFYNRIELVSSDHRPVIAEFEVEILDIDKKARSATLDLVLDKCGPPDSTVFVKVNGQADIAVEKVFTTISKLLADEAGEIVLIRHANSSLMVIFREGKSALKAIDLDGCPLGESFQDDKLVITLKNTDWHQMICNELRNNMDNTANLVTGQGPTVHLEDDEDEAAQEMNLSLGPEFNPDTICLNHDLFTYSEPTKSSSPAAENDQPPAQPPISAKDNATAINSSNIQPPQAPSKTPVPPTRPPPPQSLAGRKLPAFPATNSEGPTSLKISNFSDVPKPTQFDPFGFSELAGSNANELGEQSAFEPSFMDLSELTASLDIEEPMLPPPATLPPLPPTVPSQPKTRDILRPPRSAPPPPIPNRNLILDKDPDSRSGKP